MYSLATLAFADALMALLSGFRGCEVEGFARGYNRPLTASQSIYNDIFI
jgi:hypothetical protein